MNNNIQQKNFGEPEVPIIIIERDDEPVNDTRGGGTVVVERIPSRMRRLMKKLLWIPAVLAGMAVMFMAYMMWEYYYNIGVSISVSPSENIDKLKAEPQAEAAEVVMTSESVLGVEFDIYALHGVSGSIEFEEPDTADKSVYLYCRSSDFTPKGRYLGSLVCNGQVFSNDTKRLGYMAMANGNNVIGISRSEDVMDYVAEREGCFFRQFILVSNGELPPRFFLHGKVERCAIGRIDDRLYFITSRNKETMWSFADALREYGFIDAIYITGGYDYSFYRDRSGQRHDIHNPEWYPHTKWKGIIPWIVFRKRA
jgi:hypothetical protein